MCGVFGIATARGRRLSLDEQACVATCELLAHRGPDAAGSMHAGHVALVHRRLALLDAEGGAQPFRSTGPGPRVILAWNGEIYNHLDIRRSLAARGAVFHTRSDTETLATLLSMRGIDGLRELRGMYAIAAWFVDSDELVLARDPFGIVPLHYAEVAVPGGCELVFASEPKPITGHPSFRLEPDFASVASFMEMPRRTFGARTLYRGLHSVEPGETRRYALAGERVRCIHSARELPAAAPIARNLNDAAWIVREAVTDSVEAHLAADAPVCTLLSGGIDSTIIASIARTANPRMMTFAAGSEEDSARPGSDLFMARRVAQMLGSDHHEVLISGEQFVIAWERLITEGAHPLATPNEVAIALLSNAIAPHAKAALTGEGADEIFGGYGAPLEATLAWIDSDTTHGPQAAADFYRTAFGWAPRALIPELLNRDTLARFGDDHRGDHGDPLGHLLLDACRDAGDLGSLDAHLAVQRRVNLVNLLERLNVSLMRGSVEGRVPFADVRVLDAAMRAGGAHLFSEGEGGIATATGTMVTKRLLRKAFADVLPPEIVARPKASFPLPFESWIAAQTHWIDGPVAREVFSPAARDIVRTQAMQHWRLAWPMLNLARWLDATFE
ncbi:MAG: asparagine synthase (glutamine-hydrolyzing) [Phycisphaerales bacterium]